MNARAGHLATLHHSKIFDSLSSDEFRAVVASGVLDEHLRKGIVVPLSEASSHVCALLEGLVHVVLHGEGGEELWVTRLSNSRSVVVMPGDDAPNIMVPCALEVESATAAMYTATVKDIMAIASGNAPALMEIIELQEESMSDYCIALKETGFCAVKPRVAHRLASEVPDAVVRLTRHDLAALIKAGENRTTEALLALKSEGLIAFESHHAKEIFVIDIEALWNYR